MSSCIEVGKWVPVRSTLDVGSEDIRGEATAAEVNELHLHTHHR
jgi:hypothetical protein